MVDASRIHQGSYISIFKSLPPGKWSNSWVLQSFIQVSSLESKRTIEAPERSLGGFWHGGCPKDTQRKLHINFQISTSLGSALYPMYLQSVIMESKRTLEVPERSLGGSWHNGWPMDTSRKLHLNFQISTYPESAPSPMCLHFVIMESWRTLEVPDRILSGWRWLLYG